MLRLALGVLVAGASVSAGAQGVPGRDLLVYPLGLTGEAAAFGSGPASGLWNPATALLDSTSRGRAAVAALNAPIDLALAGQVVHAALAVRSVGTISLGVVRAAVKDLAYTETDPQSIGPDIPYSTFVTSIGLSRRVQRHVTAGVALRFQTGHVADQRASAVVTDVGVLADHLTRLDARVAASTYLLSVDDDNTPAITAAADARIWAHDTTTAVRVGYAYVHTRNAVTERYAFAQGRAGRFMARGGPVRYNAYGSATWLTRLGLAFEQGSYTIGVVREDNANGLTPTYQLAISHVFR